MATMELQRQELKVPLPCGHVIDAVWLSVGPNHPGFLFGRAFNPLFGLNEPLHMECTLGEAGRVAVGYRDGGRPCFVTMSENT